ncbi:methionyl aminopeptidase [Peptoniphilus asaccharolyticus DSM 20463]|uniref:Methionine aminopeptidase n=1 Tax=Peptoniphilus asaccharolyticus DSM 20463 TaxID=573058 RepID=A0A1W1VCY1_PEPAS|nr:type I methionyl aminopeptidase [Peptoniphilus asaccharolyticus]MBL7575599.1 type I methionyl aminopeptidase [Peptoniphilus asaccharolyticus]SMB91050.1 methionyl aminopeptidase [Peptoniphilus asaccharolyticus DSM 20463]
MIVIKTKDEIKKMQVAGKLLAEVHHNLREQIKPGVKTIELDRFVEKFLKDRGAYPEQKGYQGYPYSICASVNDEICHGFPGEYVLKDGDIITVDMVVNVDGWLADSAWSYTVGNVSDEAQKLLDVTRECMYKGIEKAVIGNRLGDIGHAIQTYAEENGYSVVREFVGHGIGRDMHEDPQVLHYGKPGRGTRIQEGMVFTVEPMINMGRHELTLDDNGWTARTLDHSLSAQYEHQIAITEDGPIIITDQGDC